MTASYDGVLLVSKSGVSACCRDLDEAVMVGQIYRSTKGFLALRSMSGKGGHQIAVCPFCGAKAVVQ